MIGLAAVDDDRMLLSGLAAWLAGATDLRLVAATDTVDGLLRRGIDGIDIVLLDLLLADHSDPADNVGRLVAAGPRVLVVSVVADPDQIMAAYAAGAAGYLTKDRDLDELAAVVRDIASGRDWCPPELAFAMAHDKRPGRPRLSAQELRLLLAYAAGMTLDAAARRIGIRPATAKHYLERIKQKYRSAGRPTYTKLDLATRVREDGLLRYALATPKRRAATAATLPRQRDGQG
jgi:two-component system, NarL family, nitrate/nitrite response regulator NarL